MNTKPVVYWDTSVWIVIFADEKQNSIYEGAMYANEKMNKGEVTLVVSQLVRLEMFKTLRGDKARNLFVDILKRSNVAVHSVSNPIVDIAFDLQQEVLSLGNGRILKSDDAIHLATAVYVEADEFYGADPHHLNLNDCLKMRKMPQIIFPPVPHQPVLPFLKHPNIGNIVSDVVNR